MTKSKNRRVKWRVDLTVDPVYREASTRPGHPLFNVSDAVRLDFRLHTLRKVLVCIADRLADGRFVHGKEDV